MGMDADRQDKHDSLHRHEQALQNGKQDDDGYKTSVLIDLCRALKTLLATDFVKPADLETFCQAKHAKQHPINWPTAALILSVVYTVLQVVEHLTHGGG